MSPTNSSYYPHYLCCISCASWYHLIHAAFFSCEHTHFSSVTSQEFTNERFGIAVNRVASGFCLPHGTFRDSTPHLIFFPPSLHPFLTDPSMCHQRRLPYNSIEGTTFISFGPPSFFQSVRVSVIKCCHDVLPLRPNVIFFHVSCDFETPFCSAPDRQWKLTITWWVHNLPFRVPHPPPEPELMPHNKSSSQSSSCVRPPIMGGFVASVPAGI